MFQFKDGTPLSRRTLASNLHTLLELCGLEPKNYNTHSFRIGAATTAAAASLPAWLITILGRWRSDSYERYIHLPQATILQVPILWLPTTRTTLESRTYQLSTHGNEQTFQNSIWSLGACLFARTVDFILFLLRFLLLSFVSYLLAESGNYAQGILSEASNRTMLHIVLGGAIVRFHSDSALLAASVWEDSVPEYGDKCCWRQPFSPTLKRLGCLAWVINGGHIHFPSLPSLLELGIGTRHSASVPREVLY